MPLDLDPRTPVLVGAAAAGQRCDDPRDALEPTALMAAAVAAAEADAGRAGLATHAQWIGVPKGLWSYTDPGRAVAERRGATDARTGLFEIGVLQPTLFSHAFSAIRRGDLDVAVIVGGEAKYRSLRAGILGDPALAAETDGRGTPDDHVVPADDVIDMLEIERSLPIPARQYAILESAMRAADGLSVEAHRRAVAELWAGFSTVAVANPDAWNRTPVTTDDLLGTAANPLLALPYTKLHCSQWNVDQAAAFIVCSVEAARRLGTDESQWVFPHAVVESNFMTPVVRRAEMYRSPAMEAVGRALDAAIGRPVGTLPLLDIYSCFPAAVQLQLRALGVASDRPLTITGGMTFGGGPLNNYTFQALARLVPMLRAQRDEIGVLTAVSGMVTKFGASAWGCTPPSDGMPVHVDVTDEAAAATAVLDIDGSHVGAATVAGYTVVYDKGAPVEAIVVADTPGGARTIATSTDPEVIAGYLGDERVGTGTSVDGRHLRS